MTPAVEQFVKCEVRRQLTKRGIRVRTGRRIRAQEQLPRQWGDRGLSQEQLPPSRMEQSGERCMTDEEYEKWRKEIEKQMEEGRGHYREARHLDDIFGKAHLKQKVCEMSVKMKLPAEVRDKLYEMLERYSHKWTVEDLLDELDKSLEGFPPTINADLIKERMKFYWGTVPQASIIKGKTKGFGQRLIEVWRNFYWWEILGMALAGSSVAVIGYKYIKEKAFENRMKKKGVLS